MSNRWVICTAIDPDLPTNGFLDSGYFTAKDHLDWFQLRNVFLRVGR